MCDALRSFFISHLGFLKIKDLTKIVCKISKIYFSLKRYLLKTPGHKLSIETSLKLFIDFSLTGEMTEILLLIHSPSLFFCQMFLMFLDSLGT